MATPVNFGGQVVLIPDSQGGVFEVPVDYAQQLGLMGPAGPSGMPIEQFIESQPTPGGLGEPFEKLQALADESTASSTPSAPEVTAHTPDSSVQGPAGPSGMPIEQFIESQPTPGGLGGPFGKLQALADESTTPPPLADEILYDAKIVNVIDGPARAPKTFDEARQQLADARKRQGEAIMRQGRLEAEALAGMGTALQKLAEHDRQSAEDIFAFHQKIAKHARESIAELEAERQELRDFRIDPNRLFKQQGLFGNLTMIISAAIGGYLAPNMGGRNPALETINQMIDLDVRAQAAEFAAMQEGLRVGENLFARNMQVWGDEAAALAQTKAMQRDGLITELEALKSRLQSPQAIAQAEAMQAALEAETAKEMLDLEDRLRQRAIQEAQVRIARMNAHTARMRLKPDTAGEVTATTPGTILHPITKEPIGVYRHAAGQNSVSAYKMTEKAQATLNAYFKTRGLLKKYTQAVEEIGRVYQGWGKDAINSPEARDVLALHRKLVTEWVRLMQGARSSDYDMKMGMEVIPPPQGLFQRSSPVKVLKSRAEEADEVLREWWNGNVISQKDPTEFFAIEEAFKPLDPSQKPSPPRPSANDPRVQQFSHGSTSIGRPNYNPSPLDILGDLNRPFVESEKKLPEFVAPKEKLPEDDKNVTRDDYEEVLLRKKRIMY